MNFFSSLRSRFTRPESAKVDVAPRAAPVAAAPVAPPPLVAPPPVAPPVADAAAPSDDTEAARGLVSHLYAPSTVDEVLDRLASVGFDAAGYYEANPDLAAAFHSPDRAVLHFLSMVKGERRAFPLPLRSRSLGALAGLPVADPGMVPALLASLGDAATRMGPFPDVSRLEAIWPALEDFARLGARPYLVVGDSHSSFYRRSTPRNGEFLLPLHVSCTGGSATGLGRPDSRSDYRRQIQALASLTTYLPFGREMPILFQFGQVDLEFVHAFRRVRSGTRAFDPAEFQAFGDTAVRSYLGFLEELFPAARRAQVIVLGVFPPAIGDAALARGYMNAHITELEKLDDEAGLKDILSQLQWPDLATRTALHRAFNQALRDGAERAGFGFVSDFDVLTAGGPTLDPRFIPFGKGEEHHLDMAPTEEPLAASLWRIMDGRAPLSIPEPRPRTQAERRARTITFGDLSEELHPDLLPWLDRPGLDPASLTPEQRSWRDTGVVELRGFLPADLIDAYVARRTGAVGPGGWKQPTPYLHVPELRALALYPPLMATMQSLLGEPMMLHLALTGWVSTERDWHQDDYLNPPFVASWYAAVWIALDDISADSGPFEYLPGSHLWPLLRLDKVKSFLTDEELSPPKPGEAARSWPKLAEEYVTPAVHTQIAAAGLPVRQFLGRKGDVLIWHGRLMHRGSLPRVPGTERRSLITHYSGAGHRPDMPDRVVDAASGGTYVKFDHPFA